MSHPYTPNIAVFVIIRNPAGEILLHQRANTGFLDGYYDLPSGHVEPNEDLRIAAARELAEETDLRVESSRLKLVHVNQNDLDMSYINFTFVAEEWQGTPKIMEPEKCNAMAFYALDALPEKCSLGVRVVEASTFSEEISYSRTTLENYAQYMHGETFQL